MTLDEVGLWEALDAELPAAIDLRRELHQRPNLSGDEAPTLARALEALGLEGQEVAGTGAVVRIGGPGRSVAIRAELDALEVDEPASVTWHSQVPGVMHACGHDVHLAASIAVARAVVAAGPPEPLTLVLQPREETYPSGAKDIVDSKILVTHECAAVVGVHVHPGLHEGVVACETGPVNGSADEFTILVHGRAGHAAYPHLTSDPVVALVHVVVGLQSIVSREVDPMASAVLGVSTLEAGAAANVVPGIAVARGTLRAFNEDVRAHLHERVVSVAASISEAFGCTSEVTIVRGEPVLRNETELTLEVSSALESSGLDTSGSVRSMGADDFSYFAQDWPSVMVFVGTTTDELLHSGAFLPSDDDLRRVARAMMAGYLGACNFLRRGSTSRDPRFSRAPIARESAPINSSQVVAFD